MKPDFRLLLPALGIWIGAFFQSLQTGHSRWYLLGIFLIAAVIARSRFFGIFLVAGLVGALVFTIHQSALQKEFFREREGKIVTAHVKVSSDVRKISGTVKGDYLQADRFIVETKTNSIDGIAIVVPALLSGTNQISGLIPGDEIEALVRVKVFPDYSTFACSLTLVSEVKTVQRASWIWRLTSSIRSEINSSLTSLPEDARTLIPGLVVGDRSLQSDGLTHAMRRSGLTHLTAVSGANFAIVAALLLLIGRSMRIRGQALWLSIAVFLTFFIFLVRPSSSVLRAAVMTGVLLLAKSRGLRASPIPALATAISLLLLINPFYVRDAGFALSVMATSGLLFLAPVVQRSFEARNFPSFVAEALAIPISATIFCLPIIVLLSGELSLISIAANFLVAPVIAIITSLGLLLMVLAPIHSSLGAIVGWVITPFALWITFIARTLSSLPFAALRWPDTWLGSAAMAFLLMALVIAVHLRQRISPRMRRATSTFMALILIVEVVLTINPFARSWIPSDWRIFQCNVGQGDALVINAGHSGAVVIDVGPDEHAIDHCLHLLGITRIDLLILTHFHADHVEGIAGAVRNRRVERIWTSWTKDPPDEVVRVNRALAKGDIESPSLGERFVVANIHLAVVATAANVSPNDSSIAVIGEVAGITFFAGGDLQRDGQSRAYTYLQQRSWEEIWDRTPIDVMKATHHGSAEQVPELVSLLRPRVSFFSVGVDNPYGHPTTSALELYRSFGRVFRTDQDHCLALARRGGNLIVVAEPTSPWAI